MASKSQNWWDDLTADVVKLSFAAFIITALFLAGVSMFSTESWEDFINGIHVELFGVLFDTLVLVLLYNWVSSLGERKREIKKNEEEIDDFRHWKSDEAKFRIIGNIKRLNRLKVTKLDLSFVDLSNPRIEKSQLIFSQINLTGSTFLRSNLSGLNMSNSEFNEIVDHNSEFVKSGLLNAKFRGCHLQGTNFSGAFLHNADFTDSVFTSNTNFADANIRFATFSNVTVDSANFEGAEVNGDFFDRMKEWNINGKNVFLDYTIFKHMVGSGVFMYRLKKFR